ncbi:MAG: GNAT family N-acetyltransferase [Armatimonadota bacterium]
MHVEVLAAGVAEKPPIERLYHLYLHDLSEFVELEVDDSGLFPGSGSLDVWWQSDALFPFLIRVDRRIAGFAFVCSVPYVSRGRTYRLNDFFILRGYRQQGVGRTAAGGVFERLRGDWEVGWAPANLPAAAFWRRVVAQYAFGTQQDGLVMQSSEEGLPGLYFNNA